MNSIQKGYEITKLGNLHSLSISCLGRKTISRRAAHQLIALRSKQNIESDGKMTRLFWHDINQ